jgi:hypothetical protein
MTTPPRDTRVSPLQTQRWDFDIITSPLPSFAPRSLTTSQVGEEVARGTPISEIVVVAGCSYEGARYLGSRERDIIITHLGNGGLGNGFTEEDFETAGCGAAWIRSGS